MHFDTTLLEFDKIISKVQSFAHTRFGKDITAKLHPTNNPLEIKRFLAETQHAYDILVWYKEPPFGGIRDLRETLHKAKIYSTLRPNEFLDLIGLLDAINNNIRYYDNTKDVEEITKDALDSYYETLGTIPDLKKEIQRVITVDGMIHDHASSTLQGIRNAINRLQRKATDSLQRIMQKQKNKLSEQLITLRNNRSVLPVKASDKHKIRGTIIDYSSSGETVYIEPDNVTQINNEIKTKQLEEEREIERLLAELTSKVADNHTIITANFHVLSELDFIFAKAKFAMEYDCSTPFITENTVELIKARHPLIKQDDVVANTIRFNKGERIIIITGPNTGGKTVALKTMGLLSIMVQSGMLIPVEEGSKTIIFKHILADIGDEQSIEQSLSTFSSHMTRIIHILDVFEQDSLILLDELGSGTDPKEGASLAMTILDYINQDHVYVIATTHYPELKAYAYNKEEIVNASVEFDVDTLKPTYRLMLGTPGKSNALLISERLGLSSVIIDHAKEHVATSQTEVSDLIDKLEQQGNILDQKIQEYDDAMKKTNRQLQENKALNDELILEKRKYKNKVSVENHELIQETKYKAKQLLRELEQLKEQSTIKEHELADLKYEVNQLHTEEKQTSSTTEHTYQKGDVVRVLKFDRNGTLLKQQKNGKWQVKMGILTSEFSEDEFEYLKSKEKKEPKTTVKSSVKKKVKTTLDLRGMRYDEANHALDKYIDDCLLSKISNATIIHGFGTLTLRKLVKDYVKNHPQITSYRDGEGNEGGNGVTVVYFD